MYRKFLNRVSKMRSGIDKRLLSIGNRNELPDSVIFYTTHKCASSFMGHFFKELSKSSLYNVVDYASSIWSLGNKLKVGHDYEPFLESNYDNLYFNKGEIYAPQRKPLDFPGRNYFKHVFFLRDPRDVLVSAYYSFGYSHKVPSNDKAKRAFLKKREEIQKMGIDKYVIAEVTDWIVPTYNSYIEYRRSASSSIFLSYDLFNSDISQFIKQLSDYLKFSIDDKSLLKLEAKQIRKLPNSNNGNAHRRSGESGQFRYELKHETLEYLNDKLELILDYWKFK